MDFSIDEGTQAKIYYLEDSRKSTYETLLRPHLNFLFRISYRFYGNRMDAEDLVQDLLVKLYSRKEDLSKVDKMRPWLLRILYRQFVDNSRKKKRSPLGYITRRLEAAEPTPVEMLPDHTSDLEERVCNRMVFSQIREALGLLDKYQRAVISLHDMEGYTLNELEILLEVPLGTLKSRLHRARMKLRCILEKKGTFSV